MTILIGDRVDVRRFTPPGSAKNSGASVVIAASEGLHLLGLRQRFWPGHHILRAGMPLFAQRADGDRGHVTLIGRSRCRIEARPAHDIAGANFRPSPTPGVSCDMPALGNVHFSLRFQ